MVRTRASKRVAAAAAAEAPGLIAQLPEELLLHVLSSCSSAEDLVACAGVARAWKELAMDPSAWSRHWQLAYGSRPRPTSLAAEFARLRLCGDAAILLGEWDYVGFYEETLRPNEKYVMAFWLRAWPSMVLNGNGFHKGICGVGPGRFDVAKPEEWEAYGRQPVIFWWLALFEDERRRDDTYRQLFGDCLLGAVNRLAVAECSKDRVLIADAMHCKTAFRDFCIDPRPPRIDQTTGVHHLVHDPYWRQRYGSGHGCCARSSATSLKRRKEEEEEEEE